MLTAFPSVTDTNPEPEIADNLLLKIFQSVELSVPDTEVDAIEIEIAGVAPMATLTGPLPVNAPILLLKVTQSAELKNPGIVLEA